MLSIKEGPINVDAFQALCIIARKFSKANEVRIWKEKIHENSYFFTTAH